MSNTYAPRHYRLPSALHRMTLVQNESDLDIQYDQNADAAPALLTQARQAVETMILAYPEFQTALTPLPRLFYTPEAGHPVIQSMLYASNRAQVGPMAAVAGAISAYVGEALCSQNRTVIVENGGDIFLSAAETVQIHIQAGSSPFSDRLALAIPAGERLGICTSSGTVGHSLSFGKCDAAVIASSNPALADALATATGNRIHTPEDLSSALDFASSFPEVSGLVLIIGEALAVWGKYPLVQLK